ncbi:MAG: hypothetical protein M3545_05870 [Acidobacteriota bacterium]|nr:hypothetical protein [Acidobacteriota bacterium]
MLFPVVDSTAPMVIIAAPALPRNCAAESASGVFEAASAGSVPSATTCASVVSPATMRMVMMSAKGTSRRGWRVSPATTGITSYPPNAKIKSRPLLDRSCSETLAPADSRVQSTKNMPAVMNTTSGRSFPAVSTLTTRLLCRIPRTLTPAMSAMMPVMSRARGIPFVAPGQ